ncbi:MAG: NUDIX hydrolase [Actinomycetota bacterium]|nr:NUDIX hydrolase [Actinomycetota bacterium]
MIGAVHHALLRAFSWLPVRGRRFVVRRLAPSFTVGSVCVIERSDGAILLLRLSYRDGWGLPGGLLKRGETAIEAARREAKEETSLDIETLGEPAVVVEAAKRRIDIVFRCRPRPGTPTEAHTGSPEVVDLNWFPPGDLPRLQEEAATALATLSRTEEPGGTGREDQTPSSRRAP